MFTYKEFIQKEIPPIVLKTSDGCVFLSHIMRLELIEKGESCQVKVSITGGEFSYIISREDGENIGKSIIKQWSGEQ